MRRYLFMYKFSLSVCLYIINVKTAEPIVSNFCMEPHVTPGKVYEYQNFKKLCLKVFIFVKF